MLPSGNGTDASYSPTFNSYYNVSLAEIAARVTTEFADADSSDDFSAGKDVRDEDDRNNGGDPEISCEDDSSDEDDDFEFDLSNLIPENGEIRPVYPVFNQDLLKDFHLVGEIESRPADTKEECSRAQVQLRNLFLEDEDPPSSSEAYCVWLPKEAPVASPSPGRCTKSNSTGSSANKAKAKAWKLRDLLKRSKSDGKEGLMLLTPKKKAEAPAVRRSTSTASSSDGNARKPMRVRAGPAAAREGYYGGGRNREGVESRRRSYLPYKQDLVGFFATPQSHRKIHLPPF